MPNAISNSIYNIFRETKQNIHPEQVMPKAPCPRCASQMILQPVGDGRMGKWHCQRCKFTQMVRLQ